LIPEGCSALLGKPEMADRAAGARALLAPLPRQTGILETRFETEEGCATIIDFIPFSTARPD
jgi:hypothetical protein